MNRRNFVLLVFGSALLGCDAASRAGTTSPAAAETTSSVKTIFIVRHAEKQVIEGERDLDLSEAGQVRAEALPEALDGVKIDEVYTSDYRRTRQTVAPVAEAAELEPVIYDPADAGGTAARLVASTAANILVAGHSNTVPALIEALGAEPPVIDEDQYGDLFVLTLDGDKASLETRRYGR